MERLLQRGVLEAVGPKVPEPWDQACQGAIRASKNVPPRQLFLPSNGDC